MLNDCGRKIGECVMRRFRFALLFLLLFLLYGCSASQTNQVETLKSWSFQFNEGTNDYSVFFGLLNKNGENISVGVDVDIRIINEDGEEVYNATKLVSEADFSYYTSQAAGEQYLANVRIAASDVIPGTSASGRVFLTVYKDDIVSFEEVDCEALYCLPLKDVQLICDTLPLELKIKDYWGNTESIIEINDVAYNFEKEYLPQLEITISGQKTHGTSNSGYDVVGYKLYDSEGYMVDSGNIYLSGLSEGDKFRDDSIIFYDVTPGMTYVLELTEYNW